MKDEALGLTTETKPASDGALSQHVGTREDPGRGGTPTGETSEMKRRFRGPLLKGFCYHCLFVVPETTSHSDCNGNDNRASKEDTHCQPPIKLCCHYRAP